MFRIAYVNGRYLRYDQAAVHVEDRGYQFADAVYEVCEVHGGALLDEQRHFDRLARSLGELRIAMPLSSRALSLVMREVVSRNRVDEGMVYLQISRGVASRDHAFPPTSVRPAVVVTAKAMPYAPRESKAAEGVAVATVKDIRWGRVDIKSVSLLPNVLAKQEAREAGAFEAWLVDAKGFVTEGSSTNAWIVSTDGALVTRHIGNDILRGVTRMIVLDLLQGGDLRLEERAFSLKEALTAREAFLTSATSGVMPVVRIDGVAIGDGRPGPVTHALRRRLLAAQNRS